MKVKYHVTAKRGGGWQGKIQGGERASVVGDTKEEVLKKTVALAKSKPDAQVIVHKRERNGIQFEWTYGNDPSSRKG